MTDSEAQELKDIQKLVIWQSENSIGGTQTHAKYESNGQPLAAQFQSSLPLESVRSMIINNRYKDSKQAKAYNPPLRKKGLSIDEYLPSKLQILS